MMVLYRAAAVWSLFFILGFTHIQARGGLTDEDTKDLLKQTQNQRSQSRPNLRRRDETDYVTQKQFNDTVNSMNNKINSMANDLKNLTKKYTDLDTAVANDVTQADFDKANGAWQGQIKEISTSLSQTNTDIKAIQTDLDKDHCADSPCKNQGTCFNRLGGYACVCKSGYGGVNCQNVGGWGLTEILTVNNGGKWGDWAMLSMCEPGSYARTFSSKLEDRLGSGHDDSCLNNIKLYCYDPIQNGDTNEIRSGTGPYGGWTGWHDCPKGTLLNSFTLKVEDSQGGGDDTAANGITMTCTDGTELAGPANEWGTFGSVAKCPEGSAICGVATKIEADQGSGDDTALNDIYMICCSAW